MTAPQNGAPLPLPPVILLVEPQLGENIGMVARAMLNCGLHQLRLVRPRDGWPSEAARAAAAGADMVLQQAQLFDDTPAAVADLQRLFAATARPRGMVARVATPDQAARQIRREGNNRRLCGVMFGGERSGLSNEDVSLADTVLRIPLNPQFNSLNLAQAVLLLGYAWFKNEGVDEPVLESGESPPASKGELEGFLSRLETALDGGGYFKSPEMRPKARRNLRNLFQRATPTAQEVRSLHGVLSSLQGQAPPKDGE